MAVMNKMIPVMCRRVPRSLRRFALILFVAIAGAAQASDGALQMAMVQPRIETYDSIDALIEQRARYADLGLRLVDVEQDGRSPSTPFSATWMPGSDRDAIWDTDDWSAFEARARTLARDGLRLVDVEFYVDDGVRHYLGVWRAGTGNFAIWVCPDWDAFLLQWQVMSMQGLQLVDIEVETESEATLYVGLYRSDLSEEDLWRDDDWNRVSQ